MKPKQKHIPVLLDKAIELLNPKSGESYLDVTAGYGGHASAVLDRIGDGGRVVLVDRDPDAIRNLRTRFGGRVEIIRSDFLTAAEDLVQDGSLFDMVLVDLGVSSPQLETPERGFSFRADGPLDMRMDPAAEISAATVVNTYPEKRLAGLIADYGEEPRARRIAQAIIRARPIRTTLGLAEVVRRVVKRSGDIDPATKTFQAIRIEVNAELSQIEAALPLLNRLLVPGGRLAVISFHSLEDRIVKTFFAAESRDCICPPKQPVCTCNHRASLKLLGKAVKGELDDVSNPRARSARLRAAVKLKQNQKEGTV